MNAGELKAGMYLASVDSVTFSPPVLIEHATAEAIGEPELLLRLTVWGMKRMHELTVMMDEPVTIEWTNHLTGPPDPWGEGTIRYPPDIAKS